MESLNDMVEYLKNAGFLTRDDVERAFLSIDRAFFVPDEYKDYAYADIAIPLKENVTISAPSVIARSIELSEIKDGSNVLEIGTGSGYSTALIKNIIKDGLLYSVEIDTFAYEYAKKKLTELDIADKIKLVNGDGKNIFFGHKLFDAIILHASFNRIYENWTKQLKEHACIVGPYEKEPFYQFLAKYKEGNIVLDIPVLYVPLI